MLRDFVTTTDAMHAEYLRRNAPINEPLDPPRHRIRAAIGQSLIQLGERLARADSHPVGKAA